MLDIASIRKIILLFWWSSHFEGESQDIKKEGARDCAWLCVGGGSLCTDWSGSVLIKRQYLR